MTVLRWGFEAKTEFWIEINTKPEKRYPINYVVQRIERMIQKEFEGIHKIEVKRIDIEKVPTLERLS